MNREVIGIQDRMNNLLQQQIEILEYHYSTYKYRDLISLLLNILAISPEYLYRDYKHRREVFSSLGFLTETCRESFWYVFWFHASGKHRRIAGYTSL